MEEDGWKKGRREEEGMIDQKKKIRVRRGERLWGRNDGEKIDWERKEKKRRRIEEYSIRYNNI